MQEQIPEDLRAKILLMFTKEVVKNTDSYKKFKIKEEGEEPRESLIKEKIEQEEIRQKAVYLRERERKEEVKEFVREKIKEDSKKISEMEKSGLLPELKMISKPKTMRKSMQIRPPAQKIPPFLRIPEPALPETVRYLKPQPIAQEIDLEKLNVLVKDPLVKIIECNGPDENILVIGMMGRKPTSIKLSKEEIEKILDKFSIASRIPVHEGLFKAAVGNLIISAVVSDIAGIKFVIRKISSGF